MVEGWSLLLEVEWEDHTSGWGGSLYTHLADRRGAVPPILLNDHEWSSVLSCHWYFS